MRDDLINRWPQIRAFLWGFLVAGLLAVLIYVGDQQRRERAAARQAIRANDITWEVCRAAMGSPVYHEHGGGWVKTDGLSADDLDKAASVYGEWVWTDAAGKFTAWPGHEDDGVDDEDVCAVAWRAGYDAATDEGR